jgi:hypothetical protein
MKPETIPIRLMMTCTAVKVESDMPSIMFAGSFPNRAEIVRCRVNNFHKVAGDDDWKDRRVKPAFRPE